MTNITGRPKFDYSKPDIQRFFKMSEIDRVEINKEIMKYESNREFLKKAEKEIL